MAMVLVLGENGWRRRSGRVETETRELGLGQNSVLVSGN